MKKAISLICILTLSITVFGSIYEPPTSMNLIRPQTNTFGFGASIGIGFFYPTDVNNYILNKLESENPYDIFYNTSIYEFINIGAVATFRPMKNIRINANGELGYAPKFIINYDKFNLGRLSLGFDTYFNKPIGSTKQSFIFGAGPYFHHMYFENFSANKLGLRIIPFGAALQFGGFQPQILLGCDLFAKKTARAVDYTGFENDLDLSYNGGFLRINLCF